MIVDVHNHIWSGKRFHHTDPQTVEMLIERMDKSGIERAVCFSRPNQIDNDYVAGAAKGYPDRITGFVVINPWAPDAVQELERGFADLGLRGLKLHPTLSGFPIDAHELVDPLFEVCDAYGYPVLSHAMGDHAWLAPSRFEEMAQTFPGVDIIMAHSGFLLAHDIMVRAAGRNDNLYLGTSVSSAFDVKMAVEEIGPKKVLMGTDTPWGYYEMELLKMELAVPNARDRDLVMGGNLLRLLGGEL
jgi:uncharacterized protein